MGRNTGNNIHRNTNNSLVSYLHRQTCAATGINRWHRLPTAFTSKRQASCCLRNTTTIPPVIGSRLLKQHQHTYSQRTSLFGGQQFTLLRRIIAT